MIGALLAWLVAADAADDAFRNRLTAGADLWVSPWAESGGIRLLLSDKMTAPILQKSPLDGAFLFNGRLSARLNEENPRWSESRLRDARIHLESDGTEWDLGRFPLDGGARIVDGIQGLGSLGEHVQIGAWAGAGADPYTTVPLGRYGGGPVVRVDAERVRVQAIGEAMVAPEGLDRLSGILTLDADPTRSVDLGSRLDVQYSGPDRPVSLADAFVTVVARPTDDLSLDVLYDAYSSFTYLTTEKQDPALSRFEQRAQAFDPELALLQSTLDPTLYHLVGGGLRWSPSRLTLGLLGRYRYHELPDNRYARVSLHEGLVGLAGGGLDLSFDQNLVLWNSSLGGDGVISAFVQPFESSSLAFDASTQLGAKPFEDRPDVLYSYFYGDLFVDWISPEMRWVIAGGYGFTRVLDLDRWDDNHMLMVRLTRYSRR